jgi:hypothetical protein
MVFVLVMEGAGAVEVAQQRLRSISSGWSKVGPVCFMTSFDLGEAPPVRRRQRQLTSLSRRRKAHFRFNNQDEKRHGPAIERRQIGS